MLTLGAVMERQKPKPSLWEDDGQYLSGWGLLAVFFGLFAFCCGLIFFCLHEKAKAPETVKNCFLICIQNNGAYCETYQPVCTEIKHVRKDD